MMKVSGLVPAVNQCKAVCANIADLPRNGHLGYPNGLQKMWTKCKAVWAAIADLLEEDNLGLIQAKEGTLPEEGLCVRVCGCARHDVPPDGLPAETHTIPQIAPAPVAALVMLYNLTGSLGGHMQPFRIASSTCLRAPFPDMPIIFSYAS